VPADGLPQGKRRRAPLLVSGASVKAARRRALEVLEQVRLYDRAHHRPSQLSGGQQQRVAVARALASEPAIVWADEPTGNLDSDTSKEVLDLLLQLNEENEQTFVVVTHDPGVGSLMDRVVQMRDGRIVRLRRTRRTHSPERKLPLASMKLCKVERSTMIHPSIAIRKSSY